MKAPAILQYDVPAFAILEAADCNRRDGENVLDAAERTCIVEALIETKDSQKDAAALLGITPQELWRKTYKHGIRQTRPGLRGVA